MLDFTPKPSEQWSANFEAVIDAAMQAHNAAQPKRRYLGASAIGHECDRYLAYGYHEVPKDDGAGFEGKTLRVFERGHSGEDLMAKRLRLAGFTLLTERQDGRQFGFTAGGWDEARGCYRFAGNCDGVITAAPYAAGLAVPALWENKVLSNKSWTDTKRKGVRASKPVYFAQMQVYMAYLDLADNPGLFTAENGDTGEIYAERVPYDREAAQRYSDRAVRIVQTQAPEEMPRVASAPTDYRCKWCDYKVRCWSGAAVPVSSISQANEMTGGWPWANR